MSIATEGFGTAYRTGDGSGGGSGGGGVTQPVLRSADFTAVVGDLDIVSTASGDVSVTLPVATVGNSNGQIIIKKITTDSNVVTIYPSAGQSIDGSSSPIIISGALDALTFISVGSILSGWMIV